MQWLNNGVNHDPRNGIVERRTIMSVYTWLCGGVGILLALVFVIRAWQALRGTNWGGEIDTREGEE